MTIARMIPNCPNDLVEVPGHHTDECNVIHDLLSDAESHSEQLLIPNSTATDKNSRLCILS